MKTILKRKKNRAASDLDCSYCGVKAAHVAKLNYTFGKDDQMIVVTNIDTVVCDNCGRHYYEGPTLKKLDEVLTHPTLYAVREQVYVASLSEV